MVITVIAASMAVRNNSGMFVPFGHAVPQFDVSFPEKFPRIVATRNEIFSLKFTKYCLAPPGPAGGAKTLPQTP